MPSPDLRQSESADGVDRVVGVGVVIGVVAAIAAGAAIWLLLTDPVSIATAVETGEISPLARQLADVLWSALTGLLAYL